MSSAGMCWWLTFIKTFMCASYAAITGRGCGWSKSICHMSIISARKFTGRFLWLAVYSTIAAFSKWRALLDKSWRISWFCSCWILPELIFQAKATLALQNTLMSQTDSALTSPQNNKLLKRSFHIRGSSNQKGSWCHAERLLVLLLSVQ